MRVRFLFRRFYAGGMTFILFFIIYMIAKGLTGVFGIYDEASVPVSILLVLALLYHGAKSRATLGMILTGLKFHRTEELGLSALRCSARIAVGWLFMPLFPLNIVCALTNRNGNTVADMLCGTSVVAVKRGRVY